MRVEQFPDFPLLLECVFEESGLESHPRLTDTTLYKSRTSALTMDRARQIILSMSPPGLEISLSSCFNYTQNLKSNTAQAKRHDEGKNVNAHISRNEAIFKIKLQQTKNFLQNARIF